MSTEITPPRDSEHEELMKAVELHLKGGSSTKQLLRQPTPGHIIRATPGTRIYFPERWDSFMRFTSKISSEIKIIEESRSKEIGNKIDKLTSNLESVEQEVTSCKEAINKLCAELDERPLIKETKLFDIDEKLNVIRPIPIVIEEYKDEVIASFPEIEVYAVADNEPEAISNLKTEIRNLYYELIETPKDELGKLPLSWLRIIERLIGKLEEA